jgi:polysaccharide biosynthesis protein PslG
MVRRHGTTPTFSHTRAAPALILTAAAIVVALAIGLRAAPPVRAATGVSSGTAGATAIKKPSALTRCLRRARKARTRRLRAARRRACLRAEARRRRASPAIPSRADLFGVAAGGAIHNEDPVTLGRDLSAIQRLHAAWLRVDLNWATIQDHGPASYNWAPIDRVVQGATARGLKVLGTIVFTPGWARPGGTAATYGPDPAQYAAFAATAARHYAALGVHSYEVWNEPNQSGAWAPRPNPAAYTQLLKAAYPAIKGADPKATVLTGGTGPAPNDGTQIAPLDFLNAVYANGGGGFFDAVAHHPYTFPAYPGAAQPWSPWYQMYGTAPSLRSLMIAHGDGAKRIWATEFGAPTNGPGGSYVSEAMQATMVKKAIAAWRRYSWAGPLFFFQGRDLSSDHDSRDNFFGFLRHDFSPKPAFAAYQAAVSGG